MLWPTVSIIDPVLQQTLPWLQQANGFVDSIMHILDAITNINDSNTVETTFSIGISLIKTIIKCGNELQKNPNNYEARANFCLAATYAYNGLC